MKISWLILILVLLLQSCDCEQQSTVTTSDDTSIVWRGSNIESQTDKFLYGNHTFVTKSIINGEGRDTGMRHGIVFKHARTNEIYTVIPEQIERYTEESDCNYTIVRFRWYETGNSLTDPDQMLDRVIKAVIIDPVETVNLIRSTIKSVEEPEEKPFNAFDSWDN